MMKLPLQPPIEPLEATQVEELPRGEGWQYEPKWDGFRCLAFREAKQVYLQSRNGRPLGRYFPDIVEAVLALRARRLVLDGELVVPVKRRLSFEQLQLRLHPAASRVAMLAEEHPAVLVVFDMLVDERGRSLMNKPLAERRAALEKFAARYFEAEAAIRLSPARADMAAAKRWLSETSGALDGVIAKRTDALYEPGGREAIFKIKNLRTADCVVAGFRYGSGKKSRRRAASLLLGLYDRQGLLQHVGYTSSLSDDEFARLTPKLERLRTPRGQEVGFTGRAPGGPSRWSTERSGQFESLRHELVVEVQYDHVTGDRFRHGTKFLRWRPDKSPRQCSMRQITTAAASTKLLQLG